MNEDSQPKFLMVEAFPGTGPGMELDATILTSAEDLAASIRGLVARNASRLNLDDRLDIEVLLDLVDQSAQTREFLSLAHAMDRLIAWRQLLLGLEKAG